MRSVILILSLMIITSIQSIGQVGREYGNPTKPFVISHVWEKNRGMLDRGNSPRHNVFTRFVCFKGACRRQVGKNKSLGAISFNRFKKKVRKNAKKGMYKNLRADSLRPKKPVIKKQQELIAKKDSVVKPQVAAPVLKSDSLIVLNEFLFETNSSKLKGEQFFELDSLMDFLLANHSLVVRISGHTDNRGSEIHNKTLSFKRAEVVAEYLIDNGVAIDRVTFEGLGSTKPLMTNTTEAGRQKNRRVELLIHDRR
jgi:outer membrane protein OmpA-like peptidoglycan-associated protein